MIEQVAAFGLVGESQVAEFSHLLLKALFVMRLERPRRSRREQRQDDENQPDDPTGGDGRIDARDEQRRTGEREPRHDAVDPVGQAVTEVEPFELLVECLRAVKLLARFGVPAAEVSQLIDPLGGDIDRRIECLDRNSVFLKFRPECQFAIAARAVGSFVPTLHSLGLAEDRLVLACGLHKRRGRFRRVVHRIEPRQRPVATKSRQMLHQFTFLFGGEFFQLGDARFKVLRQRTLFGQHLHRARETSNLGIDPDFRQLLADPRHVVEQSFARLCRRIDIQFEPLQPLDTILGEGTEVGKLLQFESAFAQPVPRRMNLLHVTEAAQVGLQL